MDQNENSLETTNTTNLAAMISDINQSAQNHEANNKNIDNYAQNTPVKKKRQYTALNGGYWSQPSDDGKRRRHSSSTPTPQPTTPIQQKPRKTETPSPPRPAFTLRRKEWVPKHEKQTTHIDEESPNSPAKENPDVTSYHYPVESVPQRTEEMPKVVTIEAPRLVLQEAPSEVKIETPSTNNDIQKTENSTTPSSRKRKEKKPKDKSQSGSSKKKKYDKSLRLDTALEQPNMQGWSEARIRAYAMRDKEPNAYYYRFNEIGEPQKSGSWSKEERKLFFKRMEELGGVDYRWGIFSMGIPGRVGYQCANFYRKLITSGEIKDENYKYDAGAKKYRYVGKADKEGSSSATPTKKKRKGRKRKPREDDEESEASSSEVDIMNSDSESETSEVLLAKAQSLLHSNNKENNNSLNTSVRSDNASDTSTGTPGEKSPRKMKQTDLGTFFADSSPSEKRGKKDTLKVPKKDKKKSPKKIAEQQRRKEEKKLAALLLKEQQIQQEQLRQSQLEYKMENEGKGKEICPKLYLGSRKVAQNLEWLTENNVKYILNVTREVKNYFPDQDIQYKRIRITDAAFEDLAAHFHDTFEFIRKAIEDSHSVLVHCSEGRSRSVAVIIAFLMQHHKWTLDQCYKFMCEKSDNLNVNDGFKRQLMDLEQRMFNSSSVNFFDKGGRKAKISPRNSMNGSPYVASPRPSSPRLNKSSDSISPSNSLNNSTNLDVSDILNTSDNSMDATSSRSIPSPVLMPPPSSNTTETVSFSTSTPSEHTRNFTMKVTDSVFTADGKLEAQIITTETLSVSTPNDSEEAENESEDSETSSQSQSQSQSQLSDSSVIPLPSTQKESANNSLLLADLQIDDVSSEPTEVGVQFIPPPTGASLTAAWDNDSASVGLDEDLLNNWLGMQ